MKASMKTIALLAALSYPCVAFAELVGIPTSINLSVDGLFGLFCVALLGLITVSDYTRRSRMAVARARAGHSAACELHRLAA
jgi:hypothetical protein